MGKGGVIGAVTAPVVAVAQTVAKDVGTGVKDIVHGSVAKGVGEVGSGAFNSIKAGVGVTPDNKLIAGQIAGNVGAAVASDPNGAISLGAAVATGDPGLVGGILPGGQGPGQSVVQAPVGSGATLGQVASYGAGGAPPPALVSQVSAPIAGSTIFILGGAGLLLLLALKRR